jgi:cytochrome P450
MIRLAGSDTTAISLRAILYYLIKAPKAYKRLQVEVDTAQSAGKLSKFITYGESLELEYLYVDTLFNTLSLLTPVTMKDKLL